MELQKMEAVIEAVLFTMGQAVELKALARAIGQDEKTTEKILHNMMDRYEVPERGIKLIELDGAYQMCTKAEHYPELIMVASEPKKPVLTEVLLETLAIIAYKQPVTKGEIEKIRGVSSDHAVNKLVEYNLVCEAGRLNAPGRPILFATTEDFLRSFGIRALDQLPEPGMEQMEAFKEAAEEEAQLTLDI